MSLHIVCTMSSPGCNIVVLEQRQLPTHYHEFNEKSKCSTSRLYSIIDIVGRLPKKMAYNLLCL